MLEFKAQKNKEVVSFIVLIPFFVLPCVSVSLQYDSFVLREWLTTLQRA